jgi:mono/diheme cytochrome c family protein
MNGRMDFERKLPTEQQDTADIVNGILTIQARFAREQKRPLGRGTHTKGVCVRATFEVFDIAKTLSDPALAARLARGLFAKPGMYQATVRFANAASTIRPDSKPDVRAVSFAVDLPAGAVGPDPARIDYSMNNAPTFPINDAHAFAAFMRVQAAEGLLGHVRALLSLSFKDLKGFFQTARNGIRQQRGPIHPYQCTRYWSNTPFLHGQDEAVKYSAIPAIDNAAEPVGKGASVLRDELLRHVNQDQAQASFDFALQLLDAGRMTFKGQTREPSFWIENASVEWPDDQAPFHVVGRLTLQGKSPLSDADCEAWFIDVTKHSLPDHRPLGSINRARWVAESASRKARLGAAPVPAAAPRSLVQRLGAITIGAIAKTAAIVLGVVATLAALAALYLIVQTDRGVGMLPAGKIDQVVYPDQGWGPGLDADARQTYYYTAQGAQLKELRYSWFRALEMPWSKTRISDPSIMRRFGFVVDRQTARNPDTLPVGFSKAYDRELNEEMLDITCAACHTGQIEVTTGGRTTALRIDGGSALHAFTNSNIGHFVPTIAGTLLGTLANPFKFNRFANAVLGPNHAGGRWALRRQMLTVAGQFGRMAWNEKWHGLVPTEEGYGRTDALARIANTVFGDHIQASNYAVGNAPVNYPPVWNIWKFDWVQYNASVSQPMARNIGESMGTGAKYSLLDRYGQPLPPDQRYRSTTLLENLHTIEQTLRKLQPPAWNEEVLGPIDQAKAARGKELFNRRCVRCHGPHIAPPALKALLAPLKGPNDPEWIVKTLCTDDIGTDPNTALNFYDAKVDLTKTGLTADDLKNVARKELDLQRARRAAPIEAEIARLRGIPGSDQAIAALQKRLQDLDASVANELSKIDPANLSVGAGLSYLGMMIREKAYADGRYTPDQQADLDGFGILDLPQVIAAYKPRPLAGVWATAPFLHNGSVPTVYDLLSPVAERPKTFRVGSREYDTVKLGLKLPESDFWVYDTSKAGNRNTGHEFNTGWKPWNEGDPPARGLIGPLLSHEDRLAIIEHLKVRNDDVDGPQEPHVPSSATCIPGARSDAKSRYVR